MLLLLVPTVCFSLIHQDLAVLQRPVLMQLMGLRTTALGREEVGDKHLQMTHEQQTLRTSDLSPTDSLLHCIQFLGDLLQKGWFTWDGVLVRFQLKLRRLPLLMGFHVSAESHYAADTS